MERVPQAGMPSILAEGRVSGLLGSRQHPGPCYLLCLASLFSTPGCLASCSTPGYLSVPLGSWYLSVGKGSFIFIILLFLIIYVFIMLGLSCSMQNLWSLCGAGALVVACEHWLWWWCGVYSWPGLNLGLCIESMESYPLDHQEVPKRWDLGPMEKENGFSALLFVNWAPDGSLPILLGLLEIIRGTPFTKEEGDYLALCW